MEPYRAFIADRLPPAQLGKGFLAQSFFTGLGITLANLSLMFFQGVFGLGQSVGIPLWVYPAFLLGSVCSIATVLISVLSTPELEPTEKELAELRASKGCLLYTSNCCYADVGITARNAAWSRRSRSAC